MQAVFNCTKGLVLPSLRMGCAGGNNLFSVGGTVNLLSKCLPVMPFIAIGGVRCKHSKRIRYNKGIHNREDGIQYHKFVYFPRDKDEVDPPYEPSKLLMVKKVRSMKKKPYWERDIMKRFKIESRRDIAIVKNTPEINAQLYLIKHLIEITPISFPYGEPTDPKYGFLKENGEMVSYNLLETEDIDLPTAQKNIEDLRKKSLERPLLKKRLRVNWFSRYE